jgi:hypothetical protein
MKWFKPKARFQNNIFDVTIGHDHDVVWALETFGHLRPPHVIFEEIRDHLQHEGIKCMFVPKARIRDHKLKAFPMGNLVLDHSGITDAELTNRMSISMLAVALKQSMPMCKVVPVFVEIKLVFNSFERWRYHVQFSVPATYHNSKI